MRIIVDHALCEGNAVCVRVAPEIFAVGDDDLVRVLVADPPASQRANIEAAVARCPRQALSLRDD
ncbi:MAG: ferredoxin [Polyangiaceae bacterium UTPRO1]|jgi:ferredoxin|nr:ferredoxin [Myxococcales bacterium]OQY66191.1 MAG: ferredoxin [Polyangiaceae bacterium UTPRO1]